MRKPSTTLTPQELAIMKVIWRLETPTVRKVYEALRKTRLIAYTSVMTMMNVLEDKRYLEKKSNGRADGRAVPVIMTTAINFTLEGSARHQ